VTLSQAFADEFNISLPPEHSSRCRAGQLVVDSERDARLRFA